MGATKKTENSHFEEKVILRLNAIKLSGKKKVRVLDAYAASQRLWKEVKKRSDVEILVTPIEKRDIPGKFYLKGDNEKFMAGMDLTRFDIIDLDAYGMPFEQIEMVFRQGFNGVVVVTFIQSGMGRLNDRFLQALGYTKEMISKCPTLFSRHGMQKMERYLAVNGVRKISGYFFDKRKNYFLFKIG